MDSQVRADKIFTRKCSITGELFPRYEQMQLSLISINGSKNIFNCSQYRANYYCRSSISEGSPAEWREWREEKTSVSETEDSVTVKERVREALATVLSAVKDFGDSTSAFLGGTSKRRKGKHPYEYYCPQEGCDQKTLSYRILTPPPNCKRESCERYRREMKLRK